MTGMWERGKDWAARMGLGGKDPAARLARARREAIAARREGVLLVRRPLAPDERPRSFIGGLPHLPPGLAWPVNERTGLPLTFVAQIDLADVPRPAGLMFPSRGRLFFFANFHEDHFAEDQHTRVLFDPERAGPADATPAPETLPPMTRGELWGWGRTDHPRARVEPPAGLFFHLVDTFYDQPYDDDFNPYSSFGPAVYMRMIRELRDDAVERATGVRRGLIDFGGRRPDAFGEPGWPATSIDVEYALMILAGDYRLLPEFGKPCPPEWLDGIRARLMERILALRSGRPRELAPEERAAVQALVRTARHALAQIDHARRQQPETSLRQFLRWERSAVRTKVNGGYAFAAWEILRSMPDPGRFVPAALLHPYVELLYGPPDYLHQLFGHGSSPQEAPAYYGDNVLLLQIGGSDTLGLPLMADAVMHFWITPKDLALGDFSRVHATWEAG
jgi:hypothetical protein